MSGDCDLGTGREEDESVVVLSVLVVLTLFCRLAVKYEWKQSINKIIESFIILSLVIGG